MSKCEWGVELLEQAGVAGTYERPVHDINPRDARNSSAMPYDEQLASRVGVYVAPAGVAHDHALSDWVGRAVAFAFGLPPK